MQNKKMIFAVLVGATFFGLSNGVMAEDGPTAPGPELRIVEDGPTAPGPELRIVEDGPTAPGPELRIAEDGPTAPGPEFGLV